MDNKSTIVILAGGLKRNTSGHWRTISFEGGDKYGLDGSRLRVQAASLLFKENPNQLIIASGGQGQLKNQLGDLTVAKVIRLELIDLGIPANVIIEENNSNNTYQQLVEIQKIIKTDPSIMVSPSVNSGQALSNHDSGALRQAQSDKKLAQGENKSITIITNKYHLPRVQAMIEYAPSLKSLKKLFNQKRVSLQSAEDVLIKFKPSKWLEMINRVYNSKAMKQRIILEQKGVEDIKAGGYKFY